MSSRSVQMRHGENCLMHGKRLIAIATALPVLAGGASGPPISGIHPQLLSVANIQNGQKPLDMSFWVVEANSFRAAHGSDVGMQTGRFGMTRCRGSSKTARACCDCRRSRVESIRRTRRNVTAASFIKMLATVLVHSLFRPNRRSHNTSSTCWVERSICAARCAMPSWRHNAGRNGRMTMRASGNGPVASWGSNDAP
jgi:hypothetical protein